MFVYEHVKTGDVLTIPDPNLQLSQLEEVQRAVAHLLEHGLTPVAVAAPATPRETPVSESGGPAVESAAAESVPT